MGFKDKAKKKKEEEEKVDLIRTCLSLLRSRSPLAAPCNRLVPMLLMKLIGHAHAHGVPDDTKAGLGGFCLGAVAVVAVVMLVVVMADHRAEKMRKLEAVAAVVTATLPTPTHLLRPAGPAAVLGAGAVLLDAARALPSSPDTTPTCPNPKKCNCLREVACRNSDAAAAIRSAMATAQRGATAEAALSTGMGGTSASRDLFKQVKRREVKLQALRIEWMATAMQQLQRWMPNGARVSTDGEICSHGAATVLGCNTSTLYYARKYKDLPAGGDAAKRALFAPAVPANMSEDMIQHLTWSLMSPFRTRTSSYDRAQQLDSAEDAAAGLKAYWPDDEDVQQHVNAELIERLREAFGSLATESEQTMKLIEWMWDPFFQRQRSGYFSRNLFWERTLGVWQGKMATVRALLHVASDSGQFTMVPAGPNAGKLVRNVANGTISNVYSEDEILYFESCLDRLTRPVPDPHGEHEIVRPQSLDVKG